ncbi:methyl-accepting chemotaxis protein, partial [Bordetella sp. BOR01]|nr:methyl-accepting chemotaxis protein [Bordetella sp. BOR01]
AALVEEAAAAAGSLQEQAQRLAEAVSVFKIIAGEVIEVPARQLASARHVPHVADAARQPVAAEREPQAAAPAVAPRQLTSDRAAQSVSSTSRTVRGGQGAEPAASSINAAAPVATRRVARTQPVAAGAGAPRPTRRAAPATATPAAATPVARRPVPADDDWESF